ncbi:MAG: DUF4416 family protein [Vulcanimicrobiota bacterium]
MGEIRKPRPVKFILPMISSDENLFEIAMNKVEERYGPFDIISETLPFFYTEYYHQEMGEQLKRKFAGLQVLMGPGELPDFKIFTDEIEREYGCFQNSELKRSINLDPGYIMMDKLILASTKDFRHRIYLRKGIYAEVTLYWSRGSFHHFQHTFPDYRSPEYIQILNSFMEKYRRQVSLLS